jgi:hypothetical protein
MDELLAKLLEAQILSEDTKSELLTAFNTKLSEAVESAKAEAQAEVRADLTEKWIGERDVLIEAIDNKVEEALTEEISELRADLDRFRDLEAEHAEKLVEAKAQMAGELKNDLRQLVEKLDSFLEIRLRTELEDLREDIVSQRENQFGRSVIEAFRHEFEENFYDKKSQLKSIRETQNRLADTEKALKEAESKLGTMLRESKMKQVLQPLKGTQREVMEAILKTVDTTKLEEGYKTFIGRVIREADEKSSEKENTVLAEGVTKPVKKTVTEGKVVSGDNVQLTESNKNQEKPSADVSHWKKLAGL